MSNSRVHLFVEGKVQGVFFRAETQSTARSYHLTGWVRNLYDGRVEAVFEGDEKDVEKMIAWCHEGPPYARVNRVQVTKEDYKGEFDSFSITH
jgi:acylphosphatase